MQSSTSFQKAPRSRSMFMMMLSLGILTTGVMESPIAAVAESSKVPQTAESAVSPAAKPAEGRHRFMSRLTAGLQPEAGASGSLLGRSTCGDGTITQSTNPNALVVGSDACAKDNVTFENFYARNFPIAAPTSVKCVEFGVEANTVSSATTVRVRLYSSPTSGTPVTANMTLITGSEMMVNVPGNANMAFFSATYLGAGILVPAGHLVVELFTPCRLTTCTPPGDGGGIFIGSNSAGQSAPSYIKAPDCGAADYVSLADIGSPNMHLVMTISTQSIAPCDVDVTELQNLDPQGPALPSMVADESVPDLLGSKLPPDLKAIRNILLAEGAQLSAHAKYRSTEPGPDVVFGYHPYPYDAAYACLPPNHEAIQDAVILDFTQPFVTHYQPAGSAPTATAIWFVQVQEPTSTSQHSCPTDVTGNNATNVDDLLFVINHWGACSGCPPYFHCRADIVGNGAVNVDDLLAVINGWGACPADTLPEPEALGVIKMRSWSVQNSDENGNNGDVQYVEIPDLMEFVANYNGELCTIFDIPEDMITTGPLKCKICRGVANYLVNKASWKATLFLCPSFGAGAPICVGVVALAEWAIKKWGVTWACKKIGWCP